MSDTKQPGSGSLFTESKVRERARAEALKTGLGYETLLRRTIKGAAESAKLKKLRERRGGFLPWEKKPVGWKEGDPVPKKADNWLQRYLAMHAATDAGHQADPVAEGITTKLLGGPLSLGLSQSINNHVILGDTPKKRRKALWQAVLGVEDESYPDAARRGLKTVPTYAAIGGGIGAAVPYLMGKPMSTVGTSGVGGATVGASLAMLRPLLQRAILGNVSRQAKRDAINAKADSPTLTSLPFGNAIAAAQPGQ